MRELRMITLELRGMLATGHLLRMAPLAFVVPALSLWPYIGSIFAPAMIATLLTLEPFYNNALNLWGGQTTSGVILPVDAALLLRRKNAATIIMTWGCAAFFTILVCYVQPIPPAAGQLVSFALYLAAVQFPLLMLGNSISWQQIRPRSRWTLEDAAGAILMLIGGGVISIPPLLLGGLPGQAFTLPACACALGLAWWRVAIPHTARIIHDQRTDLWRQIHLT